MMDVWAIHPSWVDSLYKIKDGKLVKFEDFALDDVSSQALEAAEEVAGTVYVTNDGTAEIDIDGILLDVDFSVAGVISGYRDIQEQILTAEDDPSVKRIVLNIDSPGGVVAGLFDTVELLGAVTKPIEANIDRVGASAAYALAATADNIKVRRDSVVGSIGVISTHVSIQRALEAEGVKMTVIKSGSMKDAGSPFRDMTDEEVKETKAVVDAIAEEFFTHVASSRGVDVQAVRDMEARVYSGREAVRLGLADEVLSIVPNAQTEEDIMSETIIAEERQRVTRILAASRNMQLHNLANVLIESGIDAEVSEKVFAAVQEDVEHIKEDLVAEARSKQEPQLGVKNPAFFEAMNSTAGPTVPQADKDSEFEEFSEADKKVQSILSAYNIAKGRE